ncbi:MAG: hypothetical protein WC076_12925 [Terrimicrobiaceae bacterium]|nr:hypothetical protein [Terrimicrobiaceae bacterium]
MIGSRESFNDQPELVHAIDSGLLEFNLKLIRKMAEVCVPTFLTLAEDMIRLKNPPTSQW